MVWTFNVECNICLRFCWGNAWEFINSRAHRVSQFRTTTTMLELITQLSTHGADICLADNDQQRQRSEWWCRCTWQTTDVHMATDKAVITVTMAKVSLDETYAVDVCKWDHTTNDFHSILLCCLVWLLYACDVIPCSLGHILFKLCSVIIGVFGVDATLGYISQGSWLRSRP